MTQAHNAFCYICHRPLGDSYPLMWSNPIRKMVPVCNDDRICRAIRQRYPKGKEGVAQCQSY